MRISWLLGHLGKLKAKVSKTTKGKHLTKYPAKKESIIRVQPVPQNSSNIFEFTKNVNIYWVILFCWTDVPMYRVLQKTTSCLTDCNLAFNVPKLLSGGSF